MIVDSRQIIDALPIFTVSSAGEIDTVAALVLQAANQTVPFLARLLSDLGHTELRAIPAQEFASTPDAQAAAAALKILFDQYGSDKAQPHNYHHLYGAILSNPAAVANVLEVGLGTNNEDVVSNMGSAGRPGASLRAFRDFLPNARIFGADIDKRILFREERIETFFIDQTDLDTISALGKELQMEFDLIIDDGLHSPNANLATMIFGLPKLRRGGYLIVEDIHPAHLPVWQVVAASLPARFKPFLFVTNCAYVFAVKYLG
jgi:cephalosporin hydroxylase